MANQSSQPCLPYDKEAETIDEFLSRFSLQASDQLHSARNNEQKQVVLLMKALPVAVFTDVQRSIAPNKIADATYDDIKDTLIKLYSTKKSTLGSSVQFFNSKQKPGQSIEDYARDVKYFSQQCGFEAQIPLSRIQRDVFLAGLNSTSVTTSILQVSDDLSFDEVVTKAKAFTQLHQDASRIHAPIHHTENKIEDVHRLQSPLPESYVCVRCGQRSKHKAEHCYALHLKCNLCSKIGHIAKVCRSAQHKKLKQNVAHDRKKIHVCSHDSGEDQDITCNQVRPTSMHNSCCHVVSSVDEQHTLHNTGAESRPLVGGVSSVTSQPLSNSRLKIQTRHDSGFPRNTAPLQLANESNAHVLTAATKADTAASQDFSATNNNKCSFSTEEITHFLF